MTDILNTMKTPYQAEKRHDLALLMAQINPCVGDIQKNMEKIIAVIETHQNQHDIIVFPELALCGYPPEDLLFREEFHQQISKALHTIRCVSKHCYTIIGHPSLEKEHCFNAVSVYYGQAEQARYYKQHLPNYGVFDELRYFTPGPDRPCIISVNNYQFGLCICEDLWREGPVDRIIEAGADGLICINASPFNYDKYQRREDLLHHYAQQGLFIVYVNQTGGQDELVFDGQSFAMDRTSNLVARAPAFKEALQTLKIQGEQISGTITPRLSKEQLIYEALVCGTQDYVRKNGFPGVLLGLSGGIDSALTLAIAVDALGASSVHAVMMPSRFTAEMSCADAEQQARVMGVDYSVISLEPLFNQFLAALSASPSNETYQENLQARIRGTLLMTLSNKSGNLVLVTSNKSETAVGYATLYGDMAGGFAVLKDVFKTQIYALAHYRNKLSQVIPERVLTRPPSAELAENQTDQDHLPEYAVLDAVIKLYVEKNYSPQAIIDAGYDENDVSRIINLLRQNEHKRRQAALGIKISPCAFGRDWRYPVTNLLAKNR